jgi:C4-dicarboxylate-binding protein DctP
VKKALFFILIIALSMFLLTSCGSQDTTSEPAIDASETNGEKITIKIGHIATETLPEHLAAVEFKKFVEEKSNGRVVVEIYPNGQLGGDRQMTEAVSLGTLDITTVTTSVLTTYDSKFGILDMPFSFATPEDGFKAVDGELGNYLNKLLPNYGIRNLGYMLNGVRHAVNNVRPINQPEDFKGLKLRVMESPVYIDMMTLLGANPTPMSFSEVYTSLQQGVIDGFECNAPFVFEMKFYDVQKYYSLTAHTVSFLAAIMNDKKYNSLPDDIKAIVDEGAKKYLVDYQRKLALDHDSEAMEQLKEAGMEINETSPENHKKFVDAVQPMYEKYEKEFGAEIFDLLRKYQ